MSKNAIITLFTETPLHPGTGQNVGVIDLPVQRERHTQFPYVPSSSLKGALRSNINLEPAFENAIFGAELGSKKHFAGAACFTDTRILAFPVRTLSGVFGWVTSPLIIDRLKRDLSLIDTEIDFGVPEEFDENSVLVTSQHNGTERVVIEDLVFNIEKASFVDEIAKTFARLCVGRESHRIIRSKLERDLMILNESQFRHLVVFGTEVLARNQLDSQKTSKNLWSMELIPRDTLFYSVVMVEDGRNGQDVGSNRLFTMLDEKLSNGYIQLGGNETLGHGWCTTDFYSADALRTVLNRE